MLAVVGFLLVAATSSTQVARRVEQPRKAALIRQIGTRRSAVADLDQAVRQLRQKVDDAARTASRRSQEDHDQAQRDALLAEVAGTTALKGPALIVRLADSSTPPGDTTDAGAYKIHDVDLQLVINALFAAGAEAVAVNGNRIVATTPIRAAGATIVVNFRPLNPPYRVVAIGASQDHFDQSEIARRFRHWTSQFGLGFSESHDGGATVPAFTGRVAIDDATPAG
ncbi:MAG: hypothetical protein QOG64_309 [Acidimicrobiaceae bacterium]|nr:hypothetical protein [Acidimicrobiaceae bacterium]